MHDKASSLSTTRLSTDFELFCLIIFFSFDGMLHFIFILFSRLWFSTRKSIASYCIHLLTMITLAEQKNSGNEAITRIDLIRESKTSSQIALYVTFTGLRGNSHQNENCRNIIAKVCRETEAYMLTADSDSGFRMRSRTRIACFIIASFFFCLASFAFANVIVIVN